MATRAVAVVVERAPGGGSGWMMRVGSARKFKFRSVGYVYGWVASHMRREGVGADERARVIGLMIRDLGRKGAIKTTAEAAHV